MNIFFFLPPPATRTGFEETTFERAYNALTEQLLLLRMRTVTTSEAYELCAALSACRLLLADSACSPRMRVWLNVSAEDVVFAVDSVEKGNGEE